MKERVIFNNYDIWNDYQETALENLAANGDTEPSEWDIWEEIYFLSGLEWEDELERLQDFFDGSQWLAVGTVGRWTGSHAAGTVFDSFECFFLEATRDCEYWKLWDENGHFYLKCSHHDGTNCFEIKRLTERGAAVLDIWEYNWNDSRNEAELHRNLWSCNVYTALPHFAHTVYGCPRKERTA